MASKRGYYGHRTLADGTHEPLTKAEAETLMAALAASKDKLAADMPTATDALAMLIKAEERLRDLGWWRGGGLSVRRGDDCAVIQQGSTGMWSGHYQASGEYVLFGDSVCKPRDCYLKPLAGLTPDERSWMQKCDREEAEAVWSRQGG